MLATIAGVLARTIARMHAVLQPLWINIFVTLLAAIESTSTSTGAATCKSRDMAGIGRSSVSYLRTAVCTRLWAAITIFWHLLRVASFSCRVESILWDRSSNVSTSGGIVLVKVKVLGFLLVEVLARVRSLVLQELDESVKPNSKKGPKRRSQPVDPVVAREGSQNDARTKRASWVERTWVISAICTDVVVQVPGLTTGEEHAGELSNEQC